MDLALPASLLSNSLHTRGLPGLSIPEVECRRRAMARVRSPTSSQPYQEGNPGAPGHRCSILGRWGATEVLSRQLAGTSIALSRVESVSRQECSVANGIGFDETGPPSGDPPSWIHRARLRDGLEVEVRPVRPGDAAALEAMHAGLSRETIHLRYFTGRRKLPPQQIHRFTHVDYRDQMVLVVTLAGGIIAFASYHRSRKADQRDRAEVAFEVADEYQGRGLGTLLLEELAEVALEQGIHHFAAEVLSVNRRMLEVFRESGFAVEIERRPGFVRVDFSIDPNERYRREVGRRHRVARRAGSQAGDLKRSEEANVYEFIDYQVQDVMTSPPITVGPDTSLREVEAIFEKRDFNSVPVVSADGALLGIASKLDVLRAFRFTVDSILPPYDEIMQQAVSRVYSRDLITVCPRTPLTRVLEKMIDSRCKSFPVLDGDDLVGMVAREDVLRGLRQATRGGDAPARSDLDRQSPRPPSDFRSSGHHGRGDDPTPLGGGLSGDLCSETGGARLRIVALERDGQPIEIVPNRSTVITPGDRLVVIGERAHLEVLAERAEMPSS